MIKKMMALICLGLFFMVLTVTAGDFTEGKHYIEIQGKASKQKEVREYFSFYCPACFKQEPFMGELELALPEGVLFTKNHVDGMPGRKVEIEALLSKAIITADLLKIKKEISSSIFNTIHKNKTDFLEVQDIKELFLLNDIDENEFDKVFSSFKVNTELNVMQRNTRNLRQQGIQAVPTLIINGKYKPVTSDIKTLAQYKALVLFLVEKEA
jgi:thiol:disulfide interchange protein DsbA